MMRLFIGFYPGGEALGPWETFRKTAPNWPLRWLNQSGLHLTMKFLGEVEHDKLLTINHELAQIAATTHPFMLRLKGGGAFPEKGSPSVFWTGIEGDTAPLLTLVDRVDAELKSVGFPKEDRVFHPHMSVAKAKIGEKIPGAIKTEYKDWIAPFETPMFEVNQFCLFESHLEPSGSTYQMRGCFPIIG